MGVHRLIRAYTPSKTSVIALGMMGVGWYNIGMTNNTYTAFVRFESFGEVIIEEIDIDAPSAADARIEARARLDEEYIPGGVIVKVERRFGIFT